MCITRVGRAVVVADGRARVELFDGRAIDGVDVSMVKAGKGDYVEVFGNLALSVLPDSEAKSRKRAWSAVNRAALLAAAEAGR